MYIIYIYFFVLSVGQFDKRLSGQSAVLQDRGDHRAPGEQSETTRFDVGHVE